MRTDEELKKIREEMGRHFALINIPAEHKPGLGCFISSCYQCVVYVRKCKTRLDQSGGSISWIS